MSNSVIKNIFSVQNSQDKTHKIITIFFIKLKFKKLKKRDFSLTSGERQVAETLDGIRKDHINRYLMATNEIKNNCDIKDTINCLDIFCGNGYGSYFLYEQIHNLKIQSYDASKEAIKFANKHYKKTNINFKQKFFPFKLEKNFFDVIVSLESIEHIKDDKLFLETIANSLKDDGLLIISTPNKKVMPLELNPNPFHHKHYIKEEFIQFLNTNKLQVLKTFGQDTYKMENLYVTGTLESSKMELKENYDGQFILYVCRKVNK